MRRHPPGTALIGAGLAAVLLAGACTGGGSGPSPSSSPSPSSDPKTIPQPPLGRLNERTLRRLAPESHRVDLAVPTFSHPTEITNPLFPISHLNSAVLLGRLDGKPWRAETTLLPDTKTVEWNGQHIEARQSQFVAYLEGRIFEVAVDLYAQADDGSVWYLGEDAFSYERGRVVETEGTWLAGVTGPPAMIMPGHPKVGDVYRTENVPGLVFEQVTVKKVGVTVSGPTGPVAGALVGQELHMDEVRLEDKFFAPGYGEFFSGGGRTFEATAVAVPVDALAQPDPSDLEAVSSRAIDVFDAAGSSDWKAASAALADLRVAGDTVAADHSPKRLAAATSSALIELGRAVGQQETREAQLASLGVARAALDLQLRYRAPVDVNVARFGLWTRELQSDAAAGDKAAVIGDVATLEWIRDRIPLANSDAGRVDDALRSLEGTAQAGELTAASDAAARLRETLSGLKPAS